MSIKIPKMGPSQRTPAGVPNLNIPQQQVMGESRKAMTQLGGQAAQFAHDLGVKRRKAQELAYHTKASSEGLRALSQIEREVEQEFDPNNPESSITGPLRERVEALIEESSVNAPTGEAARRYQDFLRQHLTNAEIKADSKESQIRLKADIDLYDESVESGGRDLVNAPDEAKALEVFYNAQETAGERNDEGIWTAEIAADKIEAARSTAAKSLLLGYQAQDTPGGYSRGLAFLTSESELLEGLSPEEVASFRRSFKNGLKQGQEKRSNQYFSRISEASRQLRAGDLDPDDPQTEKMLKNMRSGMTSMGLEAPDFAKVESQLNSSVRFAKLYKTIKYNTGNLEALRSMVNVPDDATELEIYEALGTQQEQVGAEEIKKRLARSGFEDLAPLIANQDGTEIAQELSKRLQKDYIERKTDGAGFYMPSTQRLKDLGKAALNGLVDLTADVTEAREDWAVWSDEIVEAQRAGGNSKDERTLIPKKGAISAISEIVNGAETAQAKRFAFKRIQNITGQDFPHVVHQMISQGDLPDGYRTLTWMDQTNEVAQEGVISALLEKDDIDENFKVWEGDAVKSAKFRNIQATTIAEAKRKILGTFSSGRFGGEAQAQALNELLDTRIKQKLMRNVPADKVVEQTLQEILPGEFAEHAGSAVHIPRFYTDIDPDGTPVQKTIDVAEVKKVIDLGRGWVPGSEQDPFITYSNLGVDVTPAYMDDLDIISKDPAEALDQFYNHLHQTARWDRTEDGTGLRLVWPDPNNDELLLPVFNFKGDPVTVDIKAASGGQIAGMPPEFVESIFDSVVADAEREGEALKAMPSSISDRFSGGGMPLPGAFSQRMRTTDAPKMGILSKVTKADRIAVIRRMLKKMKKAGFSVEEVADKEDELAREAGVRSEEIPGG